MKIPIIQMYINPYTCIKITKQYIKTMNMLCVVS